jgi:hypothetical protein
MSVVRAVSVMPGPAVGKPIHLFVSDHNAALRRTIHDVQAVAGDMYYSVEWMLIVTYLRQHPWWPKRADESLTLLTCLLPAMTLLPTHH